MNKLESIENLNLIKILSDSNNLSFLIGAGCSTDSPSCLPSGKEMMRALIDYFCIESKKKTLYELVNTNIIRFEALIESIQVNFDTELKIIDYYNRCDSPNEQHFYLAEQVKKGNIVLTTNFDHLIEKAIIDISSEEVEIIPVITKDDYVKFYNAQDLIKNGKYPVYKIHGASQNYVTKEDTKDSLITTIKGFGKGKEEMDLFQIEPFKKPLFDQATKNRILIVLGYSGSDDFDIIPTLKKLKLLNMIIWINHVNSKINYEIISMNDLGDNRNNSNLKNLCSKINLKNLGIPFYIFNANTSELLKKANNQNKFTDFSKFQITPSDWFSLHLPIDNIIRQYHVTINILLDFILLEDALDLSRELFEEARMQGDRSWENAALGYIAHVYRYKGDIALAIEYYIKGLEVAEELGELIDIATFSSNIGESFLRLHKYEEALLYLDKALVMYRDLNHRSKIIGVLNHIANIYSEQGDQEGALILILDAEKLTTEEGGDPTKRMKIFGTKSLIYERKGDFTNSLTFAQEGLKIAELLNDQASIAGQLSYIAKIHYNKKDYLTAIEILIRVINLYEKLDLKLEKAKALSNLALIHLNLLNKPMALNYFLQSYQIYEDFGLEKTEAAIKIKQLIDSLKKNI